MTTTRLSETDVDKENRRWPSPQRSAQNRSVYRALVAKCTLLIVATGCALLACEILLRVFVTQETKRLAIYDAELGWRGRPNGSGVYLRKKDDIRVPFRYNNIGFRDEDLNTKPAGGNRVLLLGDSFVESLEVKYEDTFQDILEQRLQARQGAGADVVIIASQGYSTAQELRAFRKFNDAVSPDIVLTIFYSGNDFEDNLRKQFAFLDERDELIFPENRDSQLRRNYLTAKRWLYESSHLVFLLKNRIESLTQVRLAAGSKETVDQSDDYKRQITEKLVRRTKVEVEASGARYGLVIIPARDEMQDGQSDAIAALKGTCVTNKIACLDLSDSLTPQHFFQTDVHFNEAGHAVVAEHLELFLEKFSEASKQ